MTLDCLDVQGSIDIEVTDDYEDKSFEMDLFTYTCGNTNNVTFIPGKGCRISQNRTISEISGSFRYELQLDCTLNYISQGNQNLTCLSRVGSWIRKTLLTNYK